MWNPDAEGNESERRKHRHEEELITYDDKQRVSVPMFMPSTDKERIDFLFKVRRVVRAREPLQGFR